MQKLFFRDIAFASALCSLISLVLSWNDAALVCLVLSSIIFLYLFVTSRNKTERVLKATSLRARAKGYTPFYLLGGIFGLFLVSVIISAFITNTFVLYELAVGSFGSIYIPLMMLAGLPIAWLDLRRIRQLD